jgi:hypothetical protein
MSQQARTPDQRLETPRDEIEQADTTPPNEAHDEDTIDTLIDELEALVAESRRMPFGHKLLIDEEYLHDLIDRLRIAVPSEVRQAYRILDEQERILDSARAQARQLLEQQGLLNELEQERSRVLSEAQREAESVRAEADEYAYSVLLDLQDRLAKLQHSVQNGIDALQPSSE